MKLEPPKSITDIIENIQMYVDFMRSADDTKELSALLRDYIRGYFSDMNPDEESVKVLALFAADNIYKYLSEVGDVDDFTRAYLSEVVLYLWDQIQETGVNYFYILDNELREDRFMLTVQFFALMGFAVVTPYFIKDKYHEHMTRDAQVNWVKSFKMEDFDPNKKTFTMDVGALQKGDTLDLIKKYMDDGRNIIYIEKDSTINFIYDVVEMVKKSTYTGVVRNRVPSERQVTQIT